MLVAGTTSSAATAVPESARVPLPEAGGVTIVTLASAAPASASMKPKSSAVKVYALSSTVVTVLLAAVGTLLAGALVRPAPGGVDQPESPSSLVARTCTS